MTFTEVLAVLIIGVWGTTYAQNFYVAAPNSLRLNADDTIAIASDGRSVDRVKVSIKDHPGQKKTIYEKFLILISDRPEVLKIRLDPADFPREYLTDFQSQKFVSVIVNFPTFRKELTIPISTQSGYVFIQTDRPIYTPKDTVNFRVIPLNEESLPSSEEFKLQIRNPNGNIIEEKVFSQKSLGLTKTFVNLFFNFPNYPVLGEWSASAFYGHNFQENSTVRFQLKEYVLPTFTVQLETPNIILPHEESFAVKVNAKYVYGKNLKGVVTFKLGVKRLGREATFFTTIGPKDLEDGSYKLNTSKENITRHIGWFPGLERSRFVVEAIVMDTATGISEKKTDVTCIFTTSPLVISFKRCLQDFKPGLVSVFEADFNFVHGNPALGISAVITALADGQRLNIEQNKIVSDDNGRVAFEIQTEMHHSTISVTIETNDARYAGSQATGTFMQRKFQSLNKAYIALSRSVPQRLQPGDMFSRFLYAEPAGIENIYFMVIAKGKILTMKQLPSGLYKAQSFGFTITQDMVPSFRVIAFAHYRNELLADSLKIEVRRVCKHGSEVTVTPEFSVNEPGSTGKIVIRGSEGTLVGLLGVDEAVYALSKKDLLTKAKIFNTFETHDLGCGPGGGMTVKSVLGYAGITIATNKFSSPLENNCAEIKQREIDDARQIARVNYELIKQECCNSGKQKDDDNRSCEERKNTFIRLWREERERCGKAFLECCNKAESERKKSTRSYFPGFSINTVFSFNKAIDRQPDQHFDSGTTEDKDVFDITEENDNNDNPDFIPIEDEDMFENDVLIRKDFSETWIFRDILIGRDNREEYNVSLPHSITTWVLQAVSVSPYHGICVAEPQKLISFKKIFLHLNLPYSVIRNEQVEIQATVFNYGDKRTSAVMYMYGTRGLCSGTKPGEKSERKRFVVNGQSATSVSFPVVPLIAKDFPVKFVVLSPEGSDVIERKLHVVHEGVPKEIHIPIKLDPTNQQRRAKRHVANNLYKDEINSTQNCQSVSVNLTIPEDYVPETASCSITAIGDPFGPAVKTAVHNPGGLLQLPGACGEQNMMRFAPTVYTMHYLKVTGKLTSELEAKGYDCILSAYAHQLTFQKQDGSFAIWNRPGVLPSTWLTAFVMKVFCQAKELIHINEDVLCKGVRWLIKNQESDGSYVEYHPVSNSLKMAGEKGKAPMTAFTLIALQECKCRAETENLLVAKREAVSYLENHLEDVDTPLLMAIVAYALSLSGSELKEAANEKLLSMATYDADLNMMYWKTPSSAADIETAGYGLLTQLKFNDLTKSSSIVNWLNTKQEQSGGFKSTQDTVIALQALSEYAINSQKSPINLVSNISSSEDKNFHELLIFNEENALLLQSINVNKIGGKLFINTVGQGVGSLAIKMRYNVIVPPEEVCKFDVTINVSDTNDEKKKVPEVKENVNQEIPPEDGNDENKNVPKVEENLKQDISPQDANDENKKVHKVEENLEQEILPHINPRSKAENVDEENKVKFKISICVRYLGNQEVGMSIVDAGIFSGFEPVISDLQKLQSDPKHLIESYEKSTRNIVFYLEKVPTQEKYCFSFHVIREYIIGRTQMSSVKVYDYYNPDAACSKFYSPDANSPLLDRICEGDVCECAEGSCPPNNPFATVAEIEHILERRETLKEIACDKYDYVWKGKLNGPVTRDAGFLKIPFIIENVIKEGIEKKADIEGKIRTLLVRDKCDTTAPTLLDTIYLILGKDGQKYKDSNGDIWYKYLLDKNSGVQRWTTIAESTNKQLQRDLNHVTKAMLDAGCEV